MSNPKKNFIYNIIYQILILICPLITTPYLSRVVGATGIGEYSYVYSIVYYFMLLTLLGVNNYGNRTIAKVRNNKDKLSKTFCEIYFMQLLIGIIMLAIYLAYILIFVKNYRIMFILSSLFIVSSILDINWFFFGMEEFKKTIIRNSIVKIASVILVFIFVKSKSDICKYMLIMSSTTCLSQFVLWLFLSGKINFCLPQKKNILKHLKANLILFIPVVAVSLYKMMDKVMLGMISNIEEVGYYENAEKIINIPLIFITSLGTVMLPRISNMIESKNYDKVKEYINKSIDFIEFISFPMCLGLVAVAYKITPWYFGFEFQKTGILIIMLSITLPFIGFANIIRTQYLIPREKDKIYIKSVILGAVINLIMNAIFIPMLDSIGACIGTISAEIVVMMSQSFDVKRDVPIYKYIKNVFPFFVKSLIMFIFIVPFNYLNINSLLRLFIQISLGGIIYIILNIKYIFTIIDFNKLKLQKASR